MQISVTGKHINVGSSLKNYVEKKLNVEKKRLLHTIINADVVFSETSHSFVSEIVAYNTGGLSTIKVSAEANDAYRAFEDALAKIKKKLRRHKIKVIRSKRVKPVKGLEG